MATVDMLLAALHARTIEMTTEPEATGETARLGWHRVARNAIRILAMLDPPPDVIGILHAIQDVPEFQDPASGSAMTTLGYTAGVLADTLISHRDSVRTASHGDRGQLRSCVLATLHHVAVVEIAAGGAEPSAARFALIRDLAGVTEAATYVPWRSLHDPLGALSLGPVPGGLDEAAARWAQEATDTLISSTRVTSYAFQRTAATIAAICQTAAILLPMEEGEHDKPDSVSVSASQAWRRAADWPPEVRLGGRTTELRRRSRDLEEVLAAARLRPLEHRSEQNELRAALVRAEKVATCHASALKRVVDRGVLWVSVDALGPAYLTRHPGANRNAWALDAATRYGAALVQASSHAAQLLRAAVSNAQPAAGLDTAEPILRPNRWETVSPSEPHRQGPSRVRSTRSRNVER